MCLFSGIKHGDLIGFFSDTNLWFIMVSRRHLIKIHFRFEYFELSFFTSSIYPNTPVILEIRFSF